VELDSLLEFESPGETVVGNIPALSQVRIDSTLGVGKYERVIRFSAAGGSAGASVGGGASSFGGSVGGGASVAPHPTSTIEKTRISVVRANSFFISFLLLEHQMDTLTQ
jgi:uncharacterized spore protein YtfJ